MVVDATCPLVAKVHVEARRFAAGGKTIFLIGHASHEEIEGTYGEAPTQTIVIEHAEDIDAAYPSIGDLLTLSGRGRTLGAPTIESAIAHHGISRPARK